MGFSNTENQLQEMRGMASWETWGLGCGQLLFEPTGTALVLVRGDTRAARRLCRVPNKCFFGGPVSIETVQF